MFKLDYDVEVQSLAEAAKVTAKKTGKTVEEVLDGWANNPDERIIVNGGSVFIALAKASGKSASAVIKEAITKADLIKE